MAERQKDSMGGALTCDVCGREPAVGVAASPLGPVSNAYGRNCLQAGYEPRAIVLATIYCVGKEKSDFNPGALEIIERSLEFHGLTWEQAITEAFTEEP